MSQFFPFCHFCFVSSGFLSTPRQDQLASQRKCRPSPPPNSPHPAPPSGFGRAWRSHGAACEDTSLLCLGRDNPMGWGRLEVPRCRPQTARWVSSFGRLLARWHAGTLAARPSQTDSPAAPDVRDHGWMGWSGGRVRPSAVKHATCFAAGMRRFPISRRVRPDGRPTTRSPLTCPPPPSSVIGLHYIHIRHAPFCNCLNPR